MITLALDASTYVGTVAVLEDSRVISEERAAMRGRDSELLMPAVDSALRKARIDARAVGRVVCGAGPGSFTSLRIAASIAKGIAVGCNVPLFAVSSLALIVAANVPARQGEPRRYLAVMDALRGESYVAGYSHAAGEVRQVDDLRLVPSGDVLEQASAAGATAVGPGQALDWLPGAAGVALLGSTIDAIGPVDLPTWEPIYGRLAEAQVKWEATHGRALPR